VKTAAVLAAALALGGCALSAAKPPPGALTDDELAWVRRYVRWRTVFVGATTGQGDVARARLAHCSSSLARNVGPVPSHRLRGVGRLVRRACADSARYAVLLHRFYDENDFDVGPRMAEAGSDAQDAAERAFRRLLGYLWESRRLPRVARARDESRLQPRYGAAAATITARELEVRCWARADWRRVLREAAAFRDVATIDVDAFANFYTGRINLSPKICDALDALTYRGDRPSGGDGLERLAYGVFVLAHETHHIAGVDSEALATCDGLQDVAHVASLLGASRAYAHRLALAYWQRVYPREPDEYRTPACGPERPLDRTPDDGVWP
jgi:hypothetical protein